MVTTRWIAAGLLAVAVGWWAAVSAPAQPAKQPADADLSARLAKMEKQLTQIQEQLTRLEAARPGWQKLKESERTIVLFDSVTGKVKFVYTDGTERVTEK